MDSEASSSPTRAHSPRKVIILIDTESREEGSREAARVEKKRSDSFSVRRGNMLDQMERD